MAESSTFVGTHYILGSWYKPDELGKRSGIFTSSGLAGTLFAFSPFSGTPANTLQVFWTSAGSCIQVRQIHDLKVN